MLGIEFIDTINTKRMAGHTGYLLEFNTGDRYIEVGKDSSPLPLKLILAAKFPGHDVGYFSQSTGLVPITRPGERCKSEFTASNCQDSPLEALNQGLRVLRSGGKRLLIVDFMGFIAPNTSDEMLHPDTLRILENLVRAGQDDELRKLESLIVGINYARGIHDIIRQNWYSIHIPLPGEEIRRIYYDLLTAKKGFAKLEKGIIKEEFLSLSRGCRLRDIENILRQADSENRDVQREDFNAVREASLKALVGDKLVIRQPSGLAFDDICGMDSLKNYIRMIVRAVKQGKHALAPGGFLLQGPPGTGKTYIVDAIAKEFGYTVVEWRDTKSQWLGQSEANCETVLQAIEGMSPVLVLIDEADQILSQRQEGPSGDGGASAYMFGRLLSFMGDGRHKGRIIWVLCSNRPDRIDIALADRVGCCVPLLRPSKIGIPGILVSLSAQLGIEIGTVGSEIQDIANSLPDEVSIRKLKDLIGLAALYSDNNILKPEDIESAADNILFSEDKVKVDYWTCLAIRMSTYSSLLPWMNGKEVIPENIPACLSDIVDPKSGEFDSATLDKRIFELSRMVGV